MRIGIVILPDERWSVGGRRWQQAEQYGFDHAWTYDHLGWRDLADGPWFDAVATLTAAAMVTRRIRLGTSVASPNFRHPVHFAREITALDDISQGRLMLGAGAGGLGFDAAVLGRPELSPRQRVDRFAEFLELLDALLRGDRVSWSGSYFTAVDARSTPGPVQRPRPPLVVAANGPRTMRLAARFGDGWLTTGGPAGDDLDGWWRSVAGARDRFAEAAGLLVEQSGRIRRRRRPGRRAGIHRCPGALAARLELVRRLREGAGIGGRDAAPAARAITVYATAAGAGGSGGR
jgi:alkanesulfonate monooxygenase SsuD/methylene tetrahydromethanopterin reductase-like flavin-dependent oxidoreductase (luciferase family)